jgi:shikimate dehydrogenase
VTVRVAVLGYPVGHSRSPAMHNAAFRELGLDWSYEAIEVEPHRFATVTRGLPARRFAGANVTVPHKLQALELADSASEVARAVGAANTLSFRRGTILAHNTDVDGVVRALREQAPDAPAGMRALVLGAGGAGRAVVYALLRERAAAVEVWNRRPERAVALVEDLEPYARQTLLRAVPEPTTDQAELLVNATSVGMPSTRPGEGEAEDFKLLHISADNLRDVQVVVDLVYRDGGTLLLREAKARGSTYVDGIDILVHQGAASFELWTGKQAPLEVMRLGARTRQVDRES